MDTNSLADELQSSINHAITAHAKHPKTAQDAIRFWDKKTPYVIHPIWCAMTLLTETSLPDHVRSIGYQALLWHDVLEDTELALPSESSKAVKELVEEMTFKNFREEIDLIWQRSDTAKLLKLYDKVSNLLDASWMSKDKRRAYEEYTLRLTQFVEPLYGGLNIVKIAKAICNLKSEI